MNKAIKLFTQNKAGLRLAQVEPLQFKGYKDYLDRRSTLLTLFLSRKGLIEFSFLSFFF